MPGISSSTCDSEVLRDLALVMPTTCFDVGTGEGKMGRFVRRVAPSCEITGFEVFEANVPRGAPYNRIEKVDFYDWVSQNRDWSVDVVIFGDVLEHFMRSQVFDILDICTARSKWIIVKIPILFHQNSFGGNPHEAHVAEIALDDMKRYDIRNYAKKWDRDQSFFMTYYLIRGRQE